MPAAGRCIRQAAGPSGRGFSPGDLDRLDCGPGAAGRRSGRQHGAASGLGGGAGSARSRVGFVNCSHAPSASRVSDDRRDNRAQGTVLLNAGLVPGLANLAAAELFAEHPEADCLEVAFTVLSEGTAGREGGEFAHRG